MSAFVLKSVGIQLTDIWSECQKEMIEMRDKILVLNDCLKTWEVIGRHLTECNETLVVLVEKSKMNDKESNEEITDLINDIKEHENCIEREKENLNSFKTLSEKNRFNDKRVLQLIEEWNQTEKGLSEEKSQYMSSKTRNGQEFNDKSYSIEEVVTNSNEWRKRYPKVVTNSSSNRSQNKLNKNNSNISDKNDYNSDDDFECLSERLSNSDIDYSEEESKEYKEVLNENKRSKRQRKMVSYKRLNEGMDSDFEGMDDQKEDYNCDNDSADNSTVNKRVNDESIPTIKRRSRAIVCQTLTTQEISDKLSNNECVTEINETIQSIKNIYLKTLDSNDKRIRIGFGCALNDCVFISSTKARVLRHLDAFHFNNTLYKCNQCDYSSVNEIHFEHHLLNSHSMEPELIKEIIESLEIGMSVKKTAKRRRKVGSHKTKNKAIDSDLIGTDGHLEENSTEVGSVNIDNIHNQEIIYSSEDFVGNEVVVEGVDSIENKEVKSKRSRGKRRTEVILKLTAKEISAKVWTNECVTQTDEKDDSVKKIYLRNLDPNNKRIRIGFACAHPGCIFRNHKKEKVLNHVFAVHQNYKPFGCNQCEYRTNRNYALKSHIYNMHTDKKDRPVRPEPSKPSNRCPISVKTITINKLRELIASYRTMESIDENNSLIKVYRLVAESPTQFSPVVGYGCNWIECSVLSLKKSRLNEHIRGFHQNDKPFECDFPGCKHRSVTNNILLRHKLVVHNMGDGLNPSQRPVYACEWKDCGFKSYYKNPLKVHLRQHTGEKPFKCVWPSCEFACATKGGLDLHVNTHKNYKPHECHWPGCEGRFGTKTKLRDHMLTHGDERPFKCEWPQCGKSFKSRDVRTRHQITHTGNKRFECSWPGCSSRFRDRYALNQHVLIHNDAKLVKPYECADSDCEKRFRLKTQMIKHFDKKHKNKLDLLTDDSSVDE